MAEKKSTAPSKPKAEARQRRLAQALRDNLRRRKQQQVTAGPAGKNAGATAPERAEGGGEE
jgi:hypothetical protein